MQEYFDLISSIPDFLEKYLNLDILIRLKDVGYFCGMDYASKNIYNFKYKISRYDHSISTALITWRFSKDKKATIAALFHDISTPCFSHVIDYMNKDYETQESTEALTEQILINNKDLEILLKSDNIKIKDIIDFKKYSIVDNNRPMLCADRLDGIILTSLAWTKKLEMNKVSYILDNIAVYKNENKDVELGFKNLDVAIYIYELNQEIDNACHTSEDNFMMEILAKITKYAILKSYINYEDLYRLTEKELFHILNKKAFLDIELYELLNTFYNIKLENIEETLISNVKRRSINPLVKGKRFLN